jgi:TonB-dependent receptor
VRRFNDGGAEVQVGAKASRREKTNDTDQWGYTSSNAASPNYWGAGSTSMASFTGPLIDYPLGPFGPGLDPTLIRARVAGLNRAAARLVSASALNDYGIDEDIDAAYLQGSLKFADWTVLAGVRNERTDFEARGNQVTGGTNVAPVVTRRSYSDWLPALHARYDLANGTSVRAAWTNSVVRANFSQLAPGIDLASPTEATIGNPLLDPLTSRNLDLGIEHLLGREGVVSVYVFDKDIEDFTYTTNLAGTGAWAGYTSAVSYANGDTATVRGIELAYSQSLRSLPYPWDGLIVGVNATFTDSKARLARFDRTANAVLSRNIPLPGQSDKVYNVMLGYESGPVSARIAVNYKSPYLLELGADILDPAQDRIVDTQSQVDLSLGFRASPQVQITLEALNINDESYYVYQGSSAFNSQYEEYGRTFKLGFKVELF